MWPENSRSIEAMQSGLCPPSPNPERVGRPDCSFYIRNGFCLFGSACQFNHPPDMMLTTAVRMIGQYPGRFGWPACENYLNTGHCKFGAACIFHHPKDMAGIAGRVRLNYLGYPLRPNERGCAYYLKYGLCKFGIACKFHHPEPKPSNFSLKSSYVSTGYPSAKSYMTSSLSLHGVTSQTLPGASVIPSLQGQGSTSYTPSISSQGQLGPVSLSKNLHQIGQGALVSKDSHQTDSAISENRSSQFPVYPQRPGQPECPFYMKKGYCKIGAICKFHHPKQRFIPDPGCPPSSMVLPLRPGTPACRFYCRYGYCKYGPKCKYGHPPIESLHISSASSSVNTLAVQPDTDSSSGSAVPTKGRVEACSEKGKRPSLSQTEASGAHDNTETAEAF